MVPLCCNEYGSGSRIVMERSIPVRSSICVRDNFFVCAYELYCLGVFSELQGVEMNKRSKLILMNLTIVVALFFFISGARP
jgi:hypothetical protein